MSGSRRSGGGFSSKECRLMMTEGGLSKLLKTLPKEAQAEVRPAVRAWAQDIANQAKSAAPVDDTVRYSPNNKSQQRWPGTLRDSIRFGVFNRGFSAKSGIFGKAAAAAYYAHFVEYGTKPHLNIRGGGTKGVIAKISAYAEKRRTNMHPGSREKPFLRPAAKTAGPAGARRVIEAVRRALQKATSSGQNKKFDAADRVMQRLQSYASGLKNTDLAQPPFSGEVDE